MIQTTADILDLTKAFGILWVSLFFGILFFYSAMMVRQMLLTLREMRLRFKKVDGLIQKCHAKMGAGVSGFLYIAEGIKILVKMLKDSKIIKPASKGKSKVKKK